MSARSKNVGLAIALAIAVMLLLDLFNVRTDLINGFRDGWNAALSD